MVSTEGWVSCLQQRNAKEKMGFRSLARFVYVFVLWCYMPIHVYIRHIRQYPANKGFWSKHVWKPETGSRRVFARERWVQFRDPLFLVPGFKTSKPWNSKLPSRSGLKLQGCQRPAAEAIVLGICQKLIASVPRLLHGFVASCILVFYW